MNEITTSLLGNRVRLDYPHFWKFANPERQEEEKKNLKLSRFYWERTGIIVAVYRSQKPHSSRIEFLIELPDGVLIEADARDFSIIDVGNHKS